MPNILNVATTDSGTVFPLRGSMSVKLDITPTKNFKVAFVTQDANSFPFTSSTHPFRALNSATQTSLSVGGKIGLCLTIMYDVDHGEFVVTDSNLVSGDGGAGGGSGAAPTIVVDSTVTGAAGSAAAVENVGTASAIRLKFTVPAGAPGAAGSAGTGSSLPTGGAIGQVLTKTGTANGAAGWTTPTGGAGGAGGGNNAAEIAIAPATNGDISLNKTLGYNYVITLDRASKLLNPVGYSEGDILDLIIYQDATGGRTLTVDTQYAVPNALMPALSTASGAMDRIVLRLTAGNVWVLTPFILNYGLVLPLARIGGTQFFKLGGPEAQGAMNLIQSGQTIVIQRNGKGAEATGTIVGSADSVYTIAGAPVNGGRPELLLFPTTRPAFAKALLNFESAGKTFIRDLRLAGARNDDGDARGIAPNGAHSIDVRNVQITDCNNGILSGNGDFSGTIYIADSLLSANGVGSPSLNANQGFNSSGYVHNIYTGDNESTVLIERSSFLDCKTGHNIKSRTGTTTLNQVLCRRAYAGRELNFPIGGKLYVNDSIFHKTGDAGVQNDLISIGEEGVKTSRVREYIFTNCLLQNDIVGAGRDANFLWNYDTEVSVTFIDCLFVGDLAKANNFSRQGKSGLNTNGPDITYQTVAGIRGLHTIINTGGPLGPRSNKPVGYFPIAMTAIA